MRFAAKDMTMRTHRSVVVVLQATKLENSAKPCGLRQLLGVTAMSEKWLACECVWLVVEPITASR